jgi:zinc and cadmium transporter
VFAVALITVYCLLVALASLVGGWLPSVVKLTHIRMQLIMSFVSGLMLGVALLHMMPHSMDHLKPGWAAGCMLVGVLVMFFLLRIFHVHHREDLHDEHHHHHDHEHEEPPQHHLSWVGLFVGLMVHSILDGVALAASVFAVAEHDEFALLGLGTFLAVLLHKPLDALSVTSVMSAGGWSSRSQTLVNFGFAVTAPLGALLFWFGTLQVGGGQSALIGGALAFSAGFFLCIALSDLLPEVAFHSHDRLKLSAALLVGVVLAVGIEAVHAGSHEPHHPHPHEHPHAETGES